MRAVERWLLRMAAWFYGEVLLAGVGLAMILTVKCKEWFR